ncbi:MAG: hypothetical protein V1729_01240 [Candidatus Woesearchaeota archaeon]
MEYSDLLSIKVVKFVSKQIVTLLSRFHDALKILILTGIFIVILSIAFLLYLWQGLSILPIIICFWIFFELLHWLFSFDNHDLLRGPLSPKK